MSGKPGITSNELAEFLARLRTKSAMTFTQACDALGVPAASARYWLKHLAPRFSLERPDLDFTVPEFSARKYGFESKAIATGAAITGGEEVRLLRSQVREMNARLASYDKEFADQNWIKKQLFQLKEEPVLPPDWLLKAKKDNKSPGIPEMIWSDWHWAEVVKREQLNGVNEYNLDIAHERAHRLVERTIMLLRHYMVHPKYEGIVLNLGGDMLSGIIHEELLNTNGKPIMAAVVDLWGVLQWAIRELAEEFGKVAVFCVVGNHGRSTKKWTSKDSAETSFDWLIYMYLQSVFKNDKRVSVIVPYSTDQLYAVYGHRRLLTHGNQFRGGDGIIGSIGPVTRGRQKKHSRNAEIGQGFATMIHGHFHTYSPGDRIIGNGSLIGYNQYAADNNFGVEDPKQAMWITHPQHGITFHVPVFVDESPRDAKVASISWVEVK